MRCLIMRVRPLSLLSIALHVSLIRTRSCIVSSMVTYNEESCVHERELGVYKVLFSYDLNLSARESKILNSIIILIDGLALVYQTILTTLSPSERHILFESTFRVH